MTKTLPNVTALHWHIHSRHGCESGWKGGSGCVNGSCKEEVLILMLLAMCWIPLTLEPVLAYQIRYYCTCRETQTQDVPFSLFRILNFVVVVVHAASTRSIPSGWKFSLLCFLRHLCRSAYTHTLTCWQKEGSSAIAFAGGAVDFSSLCTLFWVTIER